MNCGNNKISSQIVQKSNNDNKQNSTGITKNNKLSKSYPKMNRIPAFKIWNEYGLACLKPDQYHDYIKVPLLVYLCRACQMGEGSSEFPVWKLYNR